MDKIIAAQKDGSFLEEIKANVGTEKRKGFEIRNDKALIFKGQLCVAKDEGLKKKL